MKRRVQVFLEFEIDDSETPMEDEDFESAVSEWIADTDIMYSKELKADTLSTLSDFVGFTVFEVQPGTTEGTEDGDEGDDDEDEDADEA